MSDAFNTQTLTADIDTASTLMLAESTRRASPPPTSFDVIEVDINSLQPAESPRLQGEDVAHTRTLGEQEAELPPILVNARTMQVIDGMHRLRAARLAGRQTIKAQFIDTGQREAFLLAVKANIEHGLPLTLADREAAAAKIVAWYPEWSDRAIAAYVGLAPRTVGSIRRRSTEQSTQLNARRGRDGRVRPISTADARKRASEIISDRPEASLREVAKMVGLSLGTVYDVRERLRQGQDPVPNRQAGRRNTESECTSDVVPIGRRLPGSKAVRWAAIRSKLIEDPTLRYTDSGRAFLRWLDTRVPRDEEWDKVMDAIPPHWVDSIMGLAYSCSEEWRKFAQELEQCKRGMAQRGS